jgi:hypothetical protein
MPALNWRIGIHVVEATKHSVEELMIDGDRVLEDLAEFLYEEWLDPDGDGCLFDVKPEEVRDLGRRLSATLHEWAADKHINAWAFKDTRSEEFVTLPHPSSE